MQNTCNSLQRFTKTNKNSVLKEYNLVATQASRRAHARVMQASRSALRKVTQSHAKGLWGGAEGEAGRENFTHPALHYVCIAYTLRCVSTRYALRVLKFHQYSVKIYRNFTNQRCKLINNRVGFHPGIKLSRPTTIRNKPFTRFILQFSLFDDPFNLKFAIPLDLLVFFRIKTT